MGARSHARTLLTLAAAWLAATGAVRSAAQTEGSALAPDERGAAAPSGPATEPSAGAEALERARRAELDAPLPQDPNVTAGRLDNGLRYFIRENTEPTDRAMLRLVVEVGSIVEGENQRGLAHVLEHMAFNGTKHFEKREIVSFMESIGMRLGPGVNASTSFDATTYMLTVPTDDPANLETAFRIMRDWAANLSLEPEEIEQERRVVIEEWRGGRGAESRVGDRHYPVLFGESRYAERLPIGTLESLEGFEHDALRRFYEDWYRPDLMAVVAVGDFDAAQIEETVRMRFGDLEVPENARERPRHELPSHRDTRYSIVTDREVPTASVSVFHKMEPEPVRTVGGYRRRVVELLYNRMLDLRLQEIARRPDPPFRGASSSRGRLVRPADAYLLGAEVPEDGIVRGLEALMSESERVARFGFTESELARAKAQLLREAERRYANRHSRSSARLAAEYASALVNGTAMPGVEVEHALLERFLGGIGLDEVERAGQRWLRDSDRVVLVTAPQKAGLEPPTEDELAAALDRVASAELEPYVDEGADASLLTAVPEGAGIVDEQEKAGGVIEWTLANGVRVVLKPTSFEQDEVLFSAFSPGGTSLVADEDLVPAMTAADVIGDGGLGTLDATGLQKTLAGKIARVEPYIGTVSEGLSGRASVQDLETMLELIYLRFTAPRADAELFEAYKAQRHQQLVNREASPGVVFGDAFRRLVYGDHPRRRPMTAERLGDADLERSLELYEDRFGDASDFTFIFVGSFELDAIRPLVERYIGALPANGRTESARDNGVRFPRGVVEETVRAGLEPRAQTRIAFAPPEDLAWPEERISMRAASQLLESRLQDVLREEIGGTYGVSVGLVSYNLAERTVAPAITFAADPERIDELVAIAFDEIEAVRRDGPTERRAADTREAMLRAHETRLEENGVWLSRLRDAYLHEAEPGVEGLLHGREEIEALTGESIRAAVRRYVGASDYVRVTLRPEG